MAHPRRQAETRAERRLRVRFRRLEDLDETKLALAVWMMARRLVDAGKLDHVDADADGGPEADQPRAPSQREVA